VTIAKKEDCPIPACSGAPLRTRLRDVDEQSGGLSIRF